MLYLEIIRENIRKTIQEDTADETYNTGDSKCKSDEML